MAGGDLLALGPGTSPVGEFPGPYTRPLFVCGALLSLPASESGASLQTDSVYAMSIIVPSRLLTRPSERSQALSRAGLGGEPASLGCCYGPCVNSAFFYVINSFYMNYLLKAFFFFYEFIGLFLVLCKNSVFGK